MLPLVTNIPPLNLYTILGLSTPSSQRPVTQDDVKKACRVSLLLNHPDKVGNRSQFILQDTDNTTKRPATLHGIAVHPMHLIYRARAILSNPTLRAAYDRQLKEAADKIVAPVSNPTLAGASGMDIVDLDDLTWNAAEAMWTRACRCGNVRGFEVREAELDEVLREATENENVVGTGVKGLGSGDVVVGCQDCSLGIIVLFAADERQ